MPNKIRLIEKMRRVGNLQFFFHIFTFVLALTVEAAYSADNTAAPAEESGVCADLQIPEHAPAVDH